MAYTDKSINWTWTSSQYIFINFYPNGMQACECVVVCIFETAELAQYVNRKIVGTIRLMEVTCSHKLHLNGHSLFNVAGRLTLPQTACTGCNGV